MQRLQSIIPLFQMASLTPDSNSLEKKIKKKMFTQESKESTHLRGCFRMQTLERQKKQELTVQ